MTNPIKDKLIEHVELFGLTQETRRGYVSGVKCLAMHYNQSPEKLTNDQVRITLPQIYSTEQWAIRKVNCLLGSATNQIFPIETSIGQELPAQVGLMLQANFEDSLFDLYS